MLVVLVLLGPLLAVALAPWRRTRPLVAPLVLVPLGVLASLTAFWFLINLVPVGRSPVAVLLYGGFLVFLVLGAALGYSAAGAVNRLLGLAPR